MNHWAMLAADDYYKLKPEEAKDLANSYYIIAQGMKMDFSNPWIMAVRRPITTCGFNR